MAEHNERPEWNTEDEYWRTNYRTRPYGASGSYDDYQPGYRYGYESAQKYTGRNWDEVENNLRTEWDKYEHRGKSTWEQVKAAARDAWDRVTSRTPAGTRR